jgi:hypothetical protein
MAPHPQDALSILNGVGIVSIAKNNSYVIREKESRPFFCREEIKKKLLCNIKWL